MKINRTIKFRAYDKTSKKMYQVDRLGIGKLSHQQYAEGDNQPKTGKNKFYPSQVEIMQYTGLKDKNGVEIYEGDICIGNGHIEKEDEKFIIKYGKYKTDDWKEKYSCNTYQFGWYAEFINSKSQVHLVIPNGIKVIGNIYENLKDSDD